MAKTSAQLDEEIAEVLARWEPRGASGDQWDVARDAILEHDPQRAASIRRNIYEEYGPVESPPPSFLKALDAAPAAVRRQYEETTGVRSAAKHVEAIKDAIYRSKDPEALIAAVSAANKHVGAMKRAARKAFVSKHPEYQDQPGIRGSSLTDSSGTYDEKMYELSNLLVDAKKMVKSIQKQRNATAWRTARGRSRRS